MFRTKKKKKKLRNKSRKKGKKESSLKIIKLLLVAGNIFGVSAHN